jgi:putative N6-adenine-specific DNA methylase
LSSNRSEAFFATAPRGLEGLLAEELTALGAVSAAPVPGGVAFAGDWGLCYRANLCSRIASRVLWRVKEFGYRGEHDVYEAAAAIDWPAYFTPQRTLRVTVTAQKSPLKSLEFATLRIKDAVCDRFRLAAGTRPSVSRADPDVRIHAFLEAQQGAFYLDTSGEALFKRGWRKSAVEAPLRENLAAGIVMLSGWQPDEPFLDPMCGSGTLLMEAAAIATRRPPGAGRAFGFEKLGAFDPALWDGVRGEAGPQTRSFHIVGSDNDPRALEAASRNLAAAGFAEQVALERADIVRRTAPAAAGVMIMNPPYGERLGGEEALERFYPKLGDALKRNFAGWRCFIFTADLRLPKLIRLEPARRTPLFNGALECRLYEFRMVAGGHRRARRDPASASD